MKSRPPLKVCTACGTVGPPGGKLQRLNICAACGYDQTPPAPRPDLVGITMSREVYDTLGRLAAEAGAAADAAGIPADAAIHVNYPEAARRYQKRHGRDDG